MKIYCKKSVFQFKENNSYEFEYILSSDTGIENAKSILSAIVTNDEGDLRNFSINMLHVYFCDIKELRKIKLINLELVK